MVFDNVIKPFRGVVDVMTVEMVAWVSISEGREEEIPASRFALLAVTDVLGGVIGRGEISS